MNKEKFLRSEFGGGMIECVYAWDYYLTKQREDSVNLNRIREGLSWCQAQWEIYQLTLKHFYNIEYHFSRTDEYFGICTEDESDWLFKKEREL